MSDWQRFFDGFAPRYDDEVFTKNTEPEVRFVIQHLRPPDGGNILDVGCGTGRHSVELARQGYQVTGVDLSSGMLQVAANRAAAAGVTVEWVHRNAAEFARPASFDAAICLCEGAMCLLGADDDAMDRDVMILRNIFASLRPGGRFLLNVLNACRQIRAYSDADVSSGQFDVQTLSERSDVAAYAGEEASAYAVRERGYTPPEIRRMAAWVGFEVLGVYGGTAGSWNLEPPRLDEMELMLLAGKNQPF